MAKRTRGSDHPPGDYEVGYGKPPVATRFQKGQSGNPRGRPKGSLSMRDQLKSILQSKVALRDANGTRKVTVQEAVLRRHVEQALKGDPRALLTIVKLAEQDMHRSDSNTPPEPEVLSAEEEALIEDFIARQARSADDEEDA